MVARRGLVAALLVGLILTLTCGLAAAEEVAQPAAETVERMDIDLAQALRIAAENSVALKQAELKVREAEFNVKQVEAASIMRPNPTLRMQSQAGLDLARQELLLAKDDLALAVETDFYNVLRAENLLAVAEEALESAKRHEEVAKKKFAVGTVTKLDVIKSTRNVLSSQAAVSQARHGRDLALMKFRQTLGIGLDDPVFPVGSAFDFQPVALDLDNDLKFALENRTEIKQLEAALAVAQKNVELSDNDYTAPLTLEQALINLEKVVLQLDQAKDGLNLQIRQSYLAVIDAGERIPVLEKGVEEAEETLRLSELSYEADMITSTEVQDAQMAVLSAKTEYINAVFDYNLAKANYFRAVAQALRGEEAN